MRVCLLSYRGNPYSGGQGIYVSELARHLARQGHEVHGICGPPYPPPVEGVRWHRVPSSGATFANGVFAHENGGAPAWRDLAPLHLYERSAWALGIFPEMAAFSWRAFWTLRRLLAHCRFDVVHDNQSLGWGLLAMRELGVPVVATIHHPLTVDRLRGFEPPTSLRRQVGQTLFYPLLMQGWVARRLPRIVTVSRASAEAIARDFRVAPGRIRVVPNGLDSEGFRPGPPEAAVPGRAIFVGHVGDRNKGFAYLLRALALSRHLDHLLVVSAGARLPDWVPALLTELGVADRVRFRLQVPRAELAGWYRSAALAVSPSLFEGFGFPAAEAMACGLPVVAARGGALPEVVGEAGVLVPPRDPQALAAAIDDLLADPARRERLGRAARERVVERFRWDRAARELAGVYAEAAAAG